MMHSAPPVFPQALDGDNDDVGWALETAKVQWTRGAYADAIEWLHRAIEAAIDSGRAIRARQLTQQTNALETALQEGWIPDIQSFSEVEGEDGAEPIDLDAYEEISADVDVESLPPHARYSGAQYSEQPHSDAMELDASDLIEDVEDEAPSPQLPHPPAQPAASAHSTRPLHSAGLQPNTSARQTTNTPRTAQQTTAQQTTAQQTTAQQTTARKATARAHVDPSEKPHAGSFPVPRPSGALTQPVAHQAVATRTLRGPAPNLQYGKQARWGEEEFPTARGLDPSSLLDDPASSLASRALPSFALDEEDDRGDVPLPSFALPEDDDVEAPGAEAPRNLQPHPGSRTVRELEPELKTMPESELPPPISGVPPLNQLEPAKRQIAEIEELDPESLEPETESDAALEIEAEPLTEDDALAEIEALSEVDYEPPAEAAVLLDEHAELVPESTEDVAGEPPQEPEATLISEMLLASEPARDSESTIVQRGFPRDEIDHSPQTPATSEAAPESETHPDTREFESATADLERLSDAPLSDADPRAAVPSTLLPGGAVLEAEPAPEPKKPVEEPAPDVEAEPASQPSAEQNNSVHPVTITEPSPRARFASELEPTLVRSVPPEPAKVGDIELGTIAGLEDLPEAAQQRLAALAQVHVLTTDEEVTHFGLALVTQGSAAVMSTVADAAGARLGPRELALSHGHLEEPLPLRLVAQGKGARVATWTRDELETALRDCPWVYDDLKTSGDRLQALTGITVGPMGDQLDDMLRGMVVERCSVKHFLPHEVIAEAGRPVSGMIVLGAGRIEILPDATSDVVSESLTPGEFLFPQAILQASPAPALARAGKAGALVVFAERRVAHELLVSVPPLLGIFAQ